MSLFLHLSDLHLGRVRDEDIPDDFKTDIIPLADRLSRQEILRQTLAELAKRLSAANEELGALIISGDITVANDEEGFHMLEEVLSWLGDRCPPPEQTVVVPGNHDVMWEMPGDPALRYERFKKYVIDKGFITPLLEGIDIKSGTIVAHDLAKHYLLDRDHNWAIVPINSSHYCGSVEPLNIIPEDAWSNLAESIVKENPTLNAADIRKELRHLRLRDVARISDPGQMRAIKDVASAIRAKAGGKKPILIGVLHHQLLPVSMREEIKPFESITNLGHLRSVLQDNDYSAILHGHKHTDYCYFDYIHRMPEADVSSPHRLFVIAAPSLNVPGAKPEMVCRLIRTSDEQHAPTLSLEDVFSVETGTALKVSAARTFSLWQSPATASWSASPVHLVEGISINEVYERTLTLFNGRESSLIPNVICRVAEASDPVSLPAAYPPVKDVPTSERAAWFEKIVHWWQKEDFKKLSGHHHFNHGHRIHSYNRKVNQLDRVAEALINGCRTTRAVISLLNPQVDEPQNETSRFPSFTLVQFTVRDCEGQYCLEVIAYFRKQEMRYWWPVNIAEISQLQHKIFNRIKVTLEDKEKKALKLGVITTIAATAHLGTTVPYILVPAVDIDLEESPQKLWDMTYALCWDEMTNRESQINTWQRVMRDLLPPKDQDPAGVPVSIQGVEYLAEIAEHFGRNHEGDVKAVAICWKELEKINRRHHAKMALSQGKLADNVHNEWRDDVVLKLNEIGKIVSRVLKGHLDDLQ